MVASSDDFSAHPAAAIFPRMAEPEFENLKEDMAAKGLLDDIIRFKGKILDGRSRLRACFQLGISPRFREYDGSDPLGFAISKNLCRRNLSTSQRALIAAQVADRPWGGARIKAQNCGLTHAEAATKFGVSARQVDKASALLNAVDSGRAIQELVESVREGRVRLNRVGRLLYVSEDEQRRFLSEAGRPSQCTLGKTERWARRFDKVRNRTSGMACDALNLAIDAEKIGELSADRRNQLVRANREAAYRLLQDADRIEQLNRMPFEQPCSECGCWCRFSQVQRDS